ncbi:Cobalamin (vitamin B12) biosynthesis CobK/CbiJ, precorrin-6x reductase [Syntrophomonas zehnderi OL-4]|uniref:Cobalamin (Vitamin B12) biosynthesis CobK/CbiJ, precorrin-6x reductase n=1 Tax=Syntrophomonas zehnderi OL-4 TaxID=690567 RepID=A0A0E4GC88_9FIRM|nr:precorrin-6A reductase [Syntrophomonas zehnderi]CFY06933.1 Cobalamin (vitamin B12) biosynthesis CobK/CbiJ, precorrin-6x reductase [Syntrophomonas zehnderi OL-4]
MILVLAGTTEGREVTGLLQREGMAVSTAVLSPYGAELLPHKDGNGLVGPLDRERLKGWINIKDIQAVVDATHPFALQISQLAMRVTAEMSIPYIRLERPQLELPRHPLVKTVDRLEQMEAYFQAGQSVFSTLGTNHLEQLLKMAVRQKARLIARVLPLADVVGRCAEAGLSPDQIIALKGPFSQELNQHLFLHSGADLILSKDSGQVGGLDSKIQAALALEIPIVVWLRPTLDYPLLVNSASEVIDYLRIWRNQ